MKDKLKGKRNPIVLLLLGRRYFVVRFKESKNCIKTISLAFSNQIDFLHRFLQLI